MRISTEAIEAARRGIDADHALDAAVDRLIDTAEKMRQILAIFDTLTIDERKHFLDCLWDSDNEAFSDNLCERIGEEWRRGR